ncbi:MAG: diguanylate cyclase [Oscillospiraceae bacterium]
MVHLLKSKSISVLLAMIISLLVITTVLPCALAIQEEKNILVLHQFEVDYPAHQVFNNGLAKKLAENDSFKFNFTYEYLNLREFPDNEIYLSATANYLKLKQKYSNITPDIIIASDVESRFLSRYGKKIFGEVPIISVWDGNERYLEDLQRISSEKAIITAFINFEKNIRLILDTLPRTEKIYVIIGNSISERYILQQVKTAAEPYSEEVDFIYLNNLSYSNMIAYLKDAGANSAALFVRYMTDAENKTHMPIHVLENIIKEVNIPVFGVYSQYLGYGIVGGYLYDYYPLAQLSADMALRMLSGENPCDITPADDEYHSYSFDSRALARWGIDTSVLPAGYNLEFHTENDLLVVILVGGFVIGLETLLILGLIKNRKKRLKLEADLVKINNMLEKLVDERTMELREAQARLEALNRQLDRASRIDPLTQLYNRRHIEERLEEEYQVFLRTGQVFTIMIADVDDFKKVNDKYGHDVGDMVLKKLSETLRNSVRKYDVVARWGGEEFLVLLPRLTSDSAKERACTILKAVEQNPFYYNDTPIQITLSIGVATIQNHEKISEVIKRADTALYRGKNTGKNRVIMT